MSDDKNIAALARGLDVLDTLRGRAISGISHTDISRATRLPAATVTRILRTLIDKGYAMQLESGLYAPSVKFLQHAQCYANEIERATARINELKQRVQAGAHR